MSHLTMDFTNNGHRRALASASPLVQGGTTYSINCINSSTVPWVFYVYQTMPNQPSQIFSTAWFASPYMIGVGSSIKFSWSINYSFVWGSTGTVAPGVTFSAGGIVSCDPAGANTTTFTTASNTPRLLSPTPGQQPGSLIITEDATVPNNVFATGIGMSGYGTFVQQALANTQQVYTPEPQYWIAAATSMQMGVVLAQTVSQAEQFTFSPNVYALTAVLEQDNTWSIS